MRVVVLVVGFVLGSISFAAAQSKSLADLANYRGADREEILKAGAKKEGKLIWYTSLTAHRDIANVFEAKYPGVKVETYRAGPSDLTRRLLSEAQSKRGIADIIETTPPTLIMLRDEKLLMPYFSPYLAAYPEEAKEEVDKARVYWATDRESMISVGYNKSGVPWSGRRRLLVGLSAVPSGRPSCAVDTGHCGSRQSGRGGAPRRTS